MKRLSIIIPVYNVEKYLRECIESILKQDVEEYEVILVDDGSTDLSGTICDEYMHEKCIYVVHKQNEGLIRARLEGVELAKYEYITFVDSDDWIDLNAYGKLMNEIGEADVLCSGIFRNYESGIQTQNIIPFEDKTYLKEEIYDSILPTALYNSDTGVWDMDPSLCTKIFRKDVILKHLRQVRDLNITYGEDSAVFFPMLLDINQVKIQKGCYYHHRQFNESRPYLQDEFFYEKLFKLYEYLKEAFRNYFVEKEMISQLNEFYRKSICLKDDKNTTQMQDEIVFPFWKIKRNSKIILYGAGLVGRTYYQQIVENDFGEVISWVDGNATNIDDSINGIVIEQVETIKEKMFDYILISIKNEKAAKQIKLNLIEMGINEDRIVWSYIMYRG